MREIVNKQKAPKDIVLNNIMREIDEENGIVVDEPIEKEQRKSIPKKKQKRSWLHILFNVMLIIVILLVLFVIYIVTLATTDKTTPKPSATSSHIVVPIQENKPTKKSIKNINLLDKKTAQLTPMRKKQQGVKTLHQDTASLSSEKDEALIREKAKKALLEQMKN